MAPYLLGDDLPLFRRFEAGGIALEKLEVVDGPLATHLRYRVMKILMQEGG